MKNLPTLQLIESWQVESTFDEGTDTRSNKNCGCFKLCAFVGLKMPLPVGSGLQFTHQFFKVKLRRKGFDLCLQLVNQLLTGAVWNARNVVDGFVGIKFHALTTNFWQCIDDMATDVLKPQLKCLEQADRTRPDDQGFGLDQRCNSLSLPVLSFQSSASGIGALRLVMLFQLGNWANSALSLVI